MGLFSTRAAPNLPDAPAEYDSSYFSRFNAILRTYFSQIGAVQSINISGLNIDLNQLPTQADLATLRLGDVYRDTTAANVLKVKV